MTFLFNLLARLPLIWVHGLGALAGLALLLSPRSRTVIVGNLRSAGLYSTRVLLRGAAGVGRGILEMAPVWLRPVERARALVRACSGWEHIEAALARGRGVLLLTPHLGCSELAGIYTAARVPLTALYRPPRQDWVHTLMKRGRERGRLRTVPPARAGVRALLGALKRNEVAFILPDQAAGKGEGAWTHFLGRDAYMPTLPYRLLASTGATPLLCFCERLPWGRGYRLWIEALDGLPDDTVAAMGRVNARIEAWIRRHPDQYLWTYRIHRRVPPAGGETTTGGAA